jgi:two-component sensor histidine kinase
MTADAETLALVRELHHRVKNNFQIIASLINLRKRMAEPSAQEEIRFIEEHVTSMAVAYRLVYATGPMVEVAASELLPELVSALRVIAGLPADQIVIEGPSIEGTIGLDQAIALGLFLSVSLPPYLDHALASRGRVTLTTETQDGSRGIAISGNWGHGIEFDLLRRKLMAAYVRQLGAQVQQHATSGKLTLRILPSTAEANAPA